MKIIIIAIVLVIVSMLTIKQLKVAEPEQNIPHVSTDSSAPEVPVKPRQVEAFREDMNNFMQQQGEERKAAIDKATSQ